MANGEDGFLKSFVDKISPGIQNPRDFIKFLSGKPEKIPLDLLPDLARGTAIRYMVNKEKDDPSLASLYLEATRSLTDYLYTIAEKRGKIAIFPEFCIVKDEATDGGILAGIDPNLDYTNINLNFFALKKLDKPEGKQAFEDSMYFRNNPNIRLENIVAHVPMNDGKNHTYLWKQYIIGPNLNYIFDILDRKLIAENDELSELAKGLEKELGNLIIKRLLYWQQNALELEGVPKNAEDVTKYYITNFIKVMEDFSKYSRVEYSNEELNDFGKALDDLDWNFINQKSAVRNLGPSYANFVISTNQINIDPEKFIEMFTREGTVDKCKLDEHLFSVDTPNKYSHALEDAWDIDLSQRALFKASVVNAVIEEYSTKGIDLSAGKYLMGVYRAFRKANLILSHFIGDNFKNLDSGLIKENEFKEKELLYLNNINYSLDKGGKLLQVMLQSQPKEEYFKIFSTMLQKLKEYKQINYQNFHQSS